MLAGAAVGWIAINFMGFNEPRGTLVATLIGATGGLNAMAVVIAIGVATALIAASHFVHEKFDL